MTTVTHRSLGFWILALTQVLFFAASSAPSPLYVVYQEQWQFSSFTLTVVFASYAAALLLTLLTVGGMSDFVGRRRVLAVSLVIELVAMLAFLTADGVWWLLGARVVQGVATGLAAGALGAALTDLAPAGRPTIAPAVNTAAPATGLAVGATRVRDPRRVRTGPASPGVRAVRPRVRQHCSAALVLVPETVSVAAGALASLRPRAAVPPAAAVRLPAGRPRADRDLGGRWAGAVARAVARGRRARLAKPPGRRAGRHRRGRRECGGSVVTRAGDGPRVMRQGSLVLVVGVALFLVAMADDLDAAVLRRRWSSAAGGSARPSSGRRLRRGSGRPPASGPSCSPRCSS